MGNGKSTSNRPVTPTITDKYSMDAAEQRRREQLAHGVTVGDVKAIKQSATRDNVSCRDRYGRSLLCRAAANGFIEIAQYLLALGAELDTADEDGRTALMHAASYRHYDIVSMLVLAGANPDLFDKKGQSVYTVGYVQPVPIKQAISRALVRGTIQRMRAAFLPSVVALPPSPPLTSTPPPASSPSSTAPMSLPIPIATKPATTSNNNNSNGNGVNGSPRAAWTEISAMAPSSSTSSSTQPSPQATSRSLGNNASAIVVVGSATVTVGPSVILLPMNVVDIISLFISVTIDPPDIWRVLKLQQSATHRPDDPDSDFLTTAGIAAANAAANAPPPTPAQTGNAAAAPPLPPGRRSPAPSPSPTARSNNNATATTQPASPSAVMEALNVSVTATGI